jgi:hypothetical protein
MVAASKHWPFYKTLLRDDRRFTLLLSFGA